MDSARIKQHRDIYQGRYQFPGGDWVETDYQDGAVYQIAHRGTDSVRQKADIFFGHGRHARSYASWNGQTPVQLPLTYATATAAWYNSPGYPDKLFLNRVITARCFECHSSFAGVTDRREMVEQFDRQTVIYGIDCETCHGPGGAHIDWARQGANPGQPSKISNPKNFTRQQQIDLCALCHSGVMTSLQPAFSFKPGDRLAAFYAYNLVASSVEDLDVHGNQFGLLSMSKCFEKSEMTCGSCHDPHQDEFDKKALFSSRCMSCHQPDHDFCTYKGKSREVLMQNCIDCHMPEKNSESIVFYAAGSRQKIAAKMRTHYIKIYPETLKDVVSFIREKSNDPQ
ncbi:hypothetical protein GCM10027051_17330 [Niabella terrae]